MTIWSRDLSRSRDKLKPLYFHYHIAYGHRTWWDGNISWMDPNHKVTQHSVHFVLQSHVRNKNHYISSTRVPMATKRGTMVAYFERLLTIKSFYALITWFCKVTWQTKIIIYPQPDYPWLQTWQNDNWPWWVPTYKVTSPFDHVVLQDHVTN